MLAKLSRGEYNVQDFGDGNTGRELYGNSGKRNGLTRRFTVGSVLLLGDFNYS